MLSTNDELVMAVDSSLHLHDLKRYCKKHYNSTPYMSKKEIQTLIQVQMGIRFVHTFFDMPIRYNSTIKNYDKQTRLKMFNIQL